MLEYIKLKKEKKTTMDMKDFVTQEVTGKSILKANYKRQIDYIENQLRLLNSPLNESGEVGYTYFGNIPEDVLAYFRNKGIEVIAYVKGDTRRQFKGNAMYVFIPDEDTDALSDKELEEAANAKYEVITELEEKTTYYERYKAATSKKANSVVPVMRGENKEEDAADEAAEAIAGFFGGVLGAFAKEVGESDEDTTENGSEVSGETIVEGKEVTLGDDGYGD